MIIVHWIGAHLVVCTLLEWSSELGASSLILHNDWREEVRPLCCSVHGGDFSLDNSHMSLLLIFLNFLHEDTLASSSSHPIYVTSSTMLIVLGSSTVGLLVLINHAPFPIFSFIGWCMLNVRA